MAAKLELEQAEPGAASRAPEWVQGPKCSGHLLLFCLFLFLPKAASPIVISVLLFLFIYFKEQKRNLLLIGFPNAPSSGVGPCEWQQPDSGAWGLEPLFLCRMLASQVAA